jgi:uncharacterized protein (DUF58 family)
LKLTPRSSQYRLSPFPELLSRHLTYRFWLCVISGLGALVLALGAQEIAFLAVASPFLCAVVVSLVEGWWPVATVRGVRLSNHQVVEGDRLEFLVQVTAPRPLPWLEVELQLPGGIESVGPTRHVTPLRGTEQFRFSMCAARWGVRGPEWVSLLTRDRLGLTERLHHVALDEDIRIHPPTERLTNLVSLQKTRLMSGDHRSRRRGGGTELAEVRPYWSGDPIRSIHPRLSARRGAPYVLERHPEQASDIVLFVDSVQDIGVDLDTTLRWTVTAAMTLAEQHLRAMDRVGILDRGAGVRWLDAGMGRQAQHAIVDMLLNTSVLRSRSVDQPTIPVDRLPKGATVFALSPLLSTVIYGDLARLRQRGHEVIVVTPKSPESGSASPLARRIVGLNAEVRRRALADAGVLVIPWDPSEPLDQTLIQADLVRRRFAPSRGGALAGAGS